MSTYNVHVFSILTNKNAKRTSYTVRWSVAGKRFRDTFVTKALAESYRSKLVVAQREGVAFDEATGLPEPMARELLAVSWYSHAVEFIDMKWPHSSPNHRRSMAEALTTVTPTLLSTDRRMPPAKEIRAALMGWSFNRRAREQGPPPEHLRPTIEWLESHTVNLSALTDAALVRHVLDTLALRLDGKPAAATVIARKRAVFSSTLKYAVELRRLDTHPLKTLSWKAPKANEVVDRRVVINPAQARHLLDAVHEFAPDLVAFFGCIYYSALRPEEVLHLRKDEYQPPREPGEWGWFTLTGATVTVGQEWNDEEGADQHRTLKHRPRTATRRVPVPPELVELLAAHLDQFGTHRDGRLFVTRRGPGGVYTHPTDRPVSNSTYTRTWARARRTALTEAQEASPLAKRPYDLRHAAVSLWLNSASVFQRR